LSLRRGARSFAPSFLFTVAADVRRLKHLPREPAQRRVSGAIGQKFAAKQFQALEQW
jgi:hypothetical protein